MSLPLLAVVWLLVLLDCSLMGYRLALGTSGLVRKRPAHLRAAGRGALLGIVPAAAVTVVALVLVDRGGPSVADEPDAALARLAVVGGVYAVVILGTWAACIIPTVTVQTVASVVVFGPLTLLRPVIVVLAVGVAVVPDASAPLVALGALVAIPGVVIEPVLDRRVARRLLAPGPG